MASRAIISRAVKAQPRVARTGGTTAPPRGALAVGPSRPKYPRWDNGGKWNVAGSGGSGKQAGKTTYHQPPPPGSSAPPPPYTPTPWDSAYEQSTVGAHKKYEDTISGLHLKKTAEDQEYGLGPGYNDYQSNPYSRAALLEKTFMTANRGTSNASAAAGQLYGGSLGNALNVNRGNYDQGHDSLEKAYRAALQGISDEEAAAKQRETDEINEAAWRRLENAESSDPSETTTSATGGAGGAGGGGGTGGKGKGGKKGGAGKGPAVAPGRPAGGGKGKGKR
jgi:hypothetical protein